jgi:hypothetical protein
MARDLYGELLSNALNRKAPRNHFAAYINPNEAAMLRSQGGGVAPGGGQYMANGLPAYIGADQGFGVSGPSSDWGGGSWGGGGMTGDRDIDPGREAAAQEAAVGVNAGVAVANAINQQDARQQAAVREVNIANIANQLDPTVGLSQGINPFGTAAQRQGPARAGFAEASPEATRAIDQQRQNAYDAAQKAVDDYTGTNNTRIQALNQARIAAENLAFPDQWSRDDLVAEYAKDIPKGGIGKYSPGVKMAEQDAPAHLIAHVNQESASGGYAINDPASDVSVPAGYHMGWFPSVMGSLISGAMPGVPGGLLNLGMLAAGTYPTAGKLLGDYAIAEDIPLLGDIVRGKRDIGKAIGGALPDFNFAPVGQAIGSGLTTIGTTIGDVLGGIGSDEPPVEDSGALSRSMAGLPEGGFDPPFVPPLPDYAGGFPSVIGSGEIPQGGKEVMGGVSEEILARLEANAAAGRARIEEAERRMGMLA